jgi:hypothetical protein
MRSQQHPRQLNNVIDDRHHINIKNWASDFGVLRAGEKLTG